MAIIALPARFGFSELPTFKLQRASNQVRSKYTAVRQALVYPFAIWQLEGSLVELDGTDAAKLRSFLVQLEGIQNKFRLPVPGYFRPSTGYTGNGTVYAIAAVRSQSITVSGLTPNTPIIGDGEYFTVNDECKMMIADTASDANGRAIFNFKPGLRAALTATLPVKLQNPTVLMHADEDDVANWSLRPPFRQGAKLRATEAIEL